MAVINNCSTKKVEIILTANTECSAQASDRDLSFMALAHLSDLVMSSALGPILQMQKLSLTKVSNLLQVAQ